MQSGNDNEKKFEAILNLAGDNDYGSGALITALIKYKQNLINNFTQSANITPDEIYGSIMACNSRDQLKDIFDKLKIPIDENEIPDVFSDIQFILMIAAAMDSNRDGARNFADYLTNNRESLIQKFSKCSNAHECHVALIDSKIPYFENKENRLDISARKNFSQLLHLTANYPAFKRVLAREANKEKIVKHILDNTMLSQVLKNIVNAVKESTGTNINDQLEKLGLSKQDTTEQDIKDIRTEIIRNQAPERVAKASEKKNQSPANKTESEIDIATIEEMFTPLMTPQAQTTIVDTSPLSAKMTRPVSDLLDKDFLAKLKLTEAEIKKLNATVTAKSSRDEIQDCVSKFSEFTKTTATTSTSAIKPETAAAKIIFAEVQFKNLYEWAANNNVALRTALRITENISKVKDKLQELEYPLEVEMIENRIEISIGAEQVEMQLEKLGINNPDHAEAIFEEAIIRRTEPLGIDIPMHTPSPPKDTSIIGELSSDTDSTGKEHKEPVVKKEVTPPSKTLDKTVAQGKPEEQMLAEALRTTNAFMQTYKTLAAANNTGRSINATLNDLKSHLHDNSPLIHTIDNFLKNTNDDNYKNLKNAVSDLQKYGEEFTTKQGRFFDKKTNTISANVNKVIYTVQDKLKPGISEQEKNALRNECLKEIEKIDVVIGQLSRSPDIHQNDIDHFRMQKFHLTDLMETIKSKALNVRTYSDRPSQYADLKGKNTQEKLNNALHYLQINVSDKSKIEGGNLITLAAKNPLEAFRKEQPLNQRPDTIRFEEARTYYLQDPVKISEFNTAMGSGAVMSNVPQIISFEERSGVARIDNTYMGIINYGDAPQYLTDETLLEMAGVFLLKTYDGRQIEDYGKEFVLSKGVHPRFAIAICAFCDLCDYPRPITSVDTSSINQTYLQKMDAHLKKPATKRSIGESENAILSQSEKKENASLINIPTRPTIKPTSTPTFKPK